MTRYPLRWRLRWFASDVSFWLWMTRLRCARWWRRVRGVPEPRVTNVDWDELFRRVYAPLMDEFYASETALRKQFVSSRHRWYV